MLSIKRMKMFDGEMIDLCLPSFAATIMKEKGLTVLPALIDPHVHFRTPGATHKEDWKSGALAAIRGGITTVLDMPNTVPAGVSAKRLQEKQALINEQLKSIGIPLRYGLYLGADKNHFEEISKGKECACAVKIFMGSSMGDLLVDDLPSLERVFELSAQHDLLVAVHAEDEEILKANAKKFQGITDPAIHSKIRSREAAISATTLAIHLAAKYRARLYILHLSTKEEVDLVRKAKLKGISVFAETTPHHLFLNISAYQQQKTLVQMNPPLRTSEDQSALWEGIHDGTIDTIGTDHAPHTLKEKQRPYREAPSGIPGLETLLPLLLNAVSENKLTLRKVVELCRLNVEKIFRLLPNRDLVMVDLELTKEVNPKELKTKCGWSPYAGYVLKGWPVYTILDDKLFPAAGAS
ncbi:MAG: dihydroorotase [Chlamydiia bacterium]|nr:dihydroorotase [Chlamydiia bacterium]